MKKPIYPIVQRKKSYLKCINCSDIIISLHRHDFRTCSCYENDSHTTGCFVDGGDDYFRIGYSKENMPASGYGLFEIDYNKGKFRYLEEVPNEEQTTNTDAPTGG